MGKDNEDPFAKLAKMMKNIEHKIEQSETRMATKIDAKINRLAASLETRLERSEKAVADAQSEIARICADTGEGNLRRLVNDALSDAGGGDTLGRRPRKAGRAPGAMPRTRSESPPTAGPSSNSSRDDRFWEARKQLRVWPVPHDKDLHVGTLNFLREKLKVADSKLEHIHFVVKPINSRPTNEAQDQVIITYDSIRTRDEIRAKASNLDGRDRKVGCQLEPPDHLRSQNQALQNLAFCLKKKNPGLKRNLKFNDEERTITMDVKMDDGWKTVQYETARSIMKKTTQRSGSMSREDLRSFLNSSDVVHSDKSMDL